MSAVKPLEPRKGLFFQDFEAGQVVTSPARTITEADVVAFAALTGDWNPLHTDAIYAAQHSFGQRIAHGMLGASLATSLAMRTGILDETILAFREIQSWKFSLPIFLGDTVRSHFTIAHTRPVPRLSGGLVTINVDLINQHDQVLQHGTWVVLVMSKET